MYTHLGHISTISKKLAEEQRSDPWWICQDKIGIVHPEVCPGKDPGVWE